MEFGPRETKVYIGRLDDGSIRVTLEHVRLKLSAEAVAKTADEARFQANQKLSALVAQRASA